MSSAEYSLACGWHERGIHLATVLRAMKDTQRAGSSLFYYRGSVDAAFGLWLKNTAQVR